MAGASVRIAVVLGCVIALLTALPCLAVSKPAPTAPRPGQAVRSATTETPAVAPVPATAAPHPTGPLAEVTLAEIGFTNGLRLANLGAHRELYVPLPQSGGVRASELVLALDDISAYDARRNLEVQVNDRAAAAIVLDGKSRNRIVRVPLDLVKAKDGYLKLTFLYSGAATIDRCVDVRFVGDSVTIRPETAIKIDIGPVGNLDVATTAALMPRDVAVVLPPRRAAANDIATAITVARALISSGRRVSFYAGYDALPELAKPDDDNRWTRGVVLVDPAADAAGVADSPVAGIGGQFGSLGLLAAIRVNGTPALLVSDGSVMRAARLFGSPMLAAVRGVATASVGDAAPARLPTDRVTFAQLGVPPEQADVFGRADLTSVIDTRRLPAKTRPTRLLLDVMVAPDGAGERAVVSAFVNDHLLGSTVAATAEVTHLDLALPEGLIGKLVNVRVVIERDTAQGECRFPSQGYPAQLLGSSALMLTAAEFSARDFSDLTPQFAAGIDVLLPDADPPTRVLGIVSQVVSQLSSDTAPVTVDLVSGGNAPAPSGPFVAVSGTAPAGAAPRVRFDRGRVDVTDRSGRILLDLGGFVGGAVAQIVTAGDYPGLWIKTLANDGAGLAPAELHLDHGDVAFIDDDGVALAMSTERDTMVQISYPDQVSWLTVAGRFRSWIIASLWLFATAVLLLVLQRMFRRGPANKSG